MASLRRAPACYSIPTSRSRKACHLYLIMHYAIISLRDISKIPLCVCRSRHLIDAWIDKAQRMTGHLIGHSDHTGPERSAGASSSYLVPVPHKVEGHTCCW